MLDLNQLLKYTVENDGSDLHLKVGSSPHVRIDGRLHSAPFTPITPDEAEAVAAAILPPDRADNFRRTSEADFALSVGALGRFRVNVMRQRGAVGLVFRRIPFGTPSLDALGLPPVVRRLAEEQRGLILVTGPTGSGKSTTVASMIDHINETRACNIVTIEDPIEVLHTDKQSLVSQREIGIDTDDYAAAMKHILRQDPDVIFIGEIRDVETVSTALSAAETGHLVLSTLHTINAAETINRVIDFFPPHQQQQIRTSVAGSLKGVVSQRLLPRLDQQGGRIPAVEVMSMTGRIFERIVEAQSTDGLSEIIAEGDFYGMQTFDQHLLQLCKDGKVSFTDALSAASQPHDLRIALQSAGLIAAI